MFMELGEVNISADGAMACPGEYMCDVCQARLTCDTPNDTRPCVFARTFPLRSSILLPLPIMLNFFDPADTELVCEGDACVGAFTCLDQFHGVIDRFRARICGCIIPTRHPCEYR